MTTYVGSFQLTQQQPIFGAPLTRAVFNFASCNFDPPGMLPDVLEEVQEELVDTGVTGRRWRRIYKQFAPFRLNTVGDETTYADGMIQARNYRLANGSLGTLTVSLDSTSYIWKNVKVRGIIPSVRKGILTGSAATSGSAAVLYGIWDMVCANTAAQGSLQ